MISFLLESMFRAVHEFENGDCLVLRIHALQLPKGNAAGGSNGRQVTDWS